MKDRSLAGVLQETCFGFLIHIHIFKKLKLSIVIPRKRLGGGYLAFPAEDRIF